MSELSKKLYKLDIETSLNNKNFFPLFRQKKIRIFRVAQIDQIKRDNKDQLATLWLVSH